MVFGHRFAKLALIPVLLVLLPFLAIAGLVQAQQQPALESCNYDVRSGVPSVQLHFESSSQSAVAFTVYQGQTLFTVRQNTWFWDGTEWWVEVWTGLPNSKGTYWAEFDRLEPRCQPGSRPQPVAPVPDPEPARWISGESVIVRTNVPFVWMRGSPSPSSASVRTINSAGGLLIEKQDAARDSLGQWWWLVRDPISGDVGWVEQAALEPGELPPTPTPVPTLNLPTLVSPVDVLPTDVALPSLTPTTDLTTLVPPTDMPPDAAMPTVTPDLITQPEGWQPGDRVHIRPDISYSWLRIIPSSESSWSYAITRQELVILGGPQSDGLQNWWNVAVPSAGPDVVGWIEENALEFVRH